MSLSFTGGGTFALLITALSAVHASAEVRSLGDVTFSPPAGFDYRQRAAPDAAILTSSATDGQFQIVVLPSFRSGPAVDGDFAAAWRRYVGNGFGAEPDLRSRFDYREAGYPGRSGAASNSRGVVNLFVLRAHGRTIPIVVLANNVRVRDEHWVRLKQFLDGVRIAPDRPQPVKQTIQLTDLMGEWNEGGDSSVNWVDGFGNYAGSTIVAHGVTYNIATDGTFQSSYAGIRNGAILRGKNAGRVEVQGDLLVLRAQGTQPDRYRIISYQEAPNGVTVLTLLGAQYEPQDGNVSMYGTKWYRRPGGRE